MTEQILLLFISSIVSGIFSGGIALIILRTDMGWIKKEIDNHDTRIYNLEIKRGIYGKTQKAN